MDDAQSLFRQMVDIPTALREITGLYFDFREMKNDQNTSQTILDFFAFAWLTEL